MTGERDPKAPGRRAYEAPKLRLVELDVMASFPDNCKMDVGTGGFGGSLGACTQSSTPTVMCMTIGS